ncbi:hypothetical protein [Streptomyces sp. NPDC049813]|uniref:hypothetical protein n=1 Tax=Streptomyces sp. NPDC049813 TaxID=3365597 RepID=UPI0037B27456
MNLEDPNDSSRNLRKKDCIFRVLYAVGIASWMTVFIELAIRQREYPVWVGPMTLLDIWCITIAATSLRDLWSATTGTPSFLTPPGAALKPAQQPATS